MKKVKIIVGIIVLWIIAVFLVLIKIKYTQENQVTNTFMEYKEDFKTLQQYIDDKYWDISFYKNSDYNEYDIINVDELWDKYLEYFFKKYYIDSVSNSNYLFSITISYDYHYYYYYDKKSYKNSCKWYDEIPFITKKISPFTLGNYRVCVGDWWVSSYSFST